MNIIKKIKTFFKNPRLGYIHIFQKCGFLFKDSIYIKILYFLENSEWLNLNNPQTFNEKLQWLKLYAHKPVYTLMADKYAVKKIVSEKIGSQYVVPCLGKWTDANDIEINKLPNQFVLKCNHDSGGVAVCKNKSTFDFEAAKERLNRSLRKGYFYQGRDKQYRDIERCILADLYLDDGREGELQDYKFWCFNGTPKVMYMTNKGKKIYENFYDMDFNPLDINHGFERYKPEYDRPIEFEKMKSLAAKLSEGIPFVRVDFFYVKGNIYFGEYTFFDWGGFKAFTSKDWDIRLGSWIDINNFKKITNIKNERN